MSLQGAGIGEGDWEGVGMGTGEGDGVGVVLWAGQRLQDPAKKKKKGQQSSVLQLHPLLRGIGSQTCALAHLRRSRPTSSPSTAAQPGLIISLLLQQPPKHSDDLSATVAAMQTATYLNNSERSKPRITLPHLAWSAHE